MRQRTLTIGAMSTMAVAACLVVTSRPGSTTLAQVPVEPTLTVEVPKDTPSPTAPAPLPEAGAPQPDEPLALPSAERPRATADPIMPVMSPVEEARLGTGINQDDPMQAVESFVRRNRREAGEAVKALTQEAEVLRARLAKVDAALERWKAVANALGSGQDEAAHEAPPPAPDPVPHEAAHEAPPPAPADPLPQLEPAPVLPPRGRE